MDMTYNEVLRAALALVIVLGLIGLVTLAARRMGLGGAHAAVRFGRERRLSVVETLALDPRRRLVLLRRDETEHLVILGPNGETVVERNAGRASFKDQLSGLEPLEDADGGAPGGPAGLAARRERQL